MEIFGSNPDDLTMRHISELEIPINGEMTKVESIIMVGGSQIAVFKHKGRELRFTKSQIATHDGDFAVRNYLKDAK